jgi:hypothetical protein
MKIVVSAKLLRMLALLSCTLLLQACSPSTTALKPVVEQNKQNMGALSQNVKVLLELYEPLLTATGNTLIFQYIARLEVEWIAVVGPSVLPLKADTWEEAFNLSANSFMGKRYKFKERYDLTKLALARGLNEDERRAVRQKEGWVFNALSDPSFTPQKAHSLLKTLGELRKSNVGGKDNTFYQEAERRLLPYSPRLENVRGSIGAAIELMEGLKYEIYYSLEVSAIHSQALANYAQSEMNLTQSLQNIDGNAITSLLTALSGKYIKNPEYREAAVKMITQGGQHLLKKL